MKAYLVAAVQDERKVVMRILNSDLLYLIGLAIKITNRVQRTRRLVGAINAGAIKGMHHSYSLLTIDIILMRTFIVANLNC